MSDASTYLYFFPDQEITAEELTEILAGDDRERRRWAMSNLLRYALWEDIWQFVDRDEVREMLDELELSDNLRQAWSRMLKSEAPVG